MMYPSLWKKIGNKTISLLRPFEFSRAFVYVTCSACRASHAQPIGACMAHAVKIKTNAFSVKSQKRKPIKAVNHRRLSNDNLCPHSPMKIEIT